MKTSLLFLLLFSIAAFVSGQTIKMKISGYTPTDGETVVALQFTDTLPTNLGSGTGSGSGISKLDPLRIKKATGLSSVELFKRSVVGTTLQQVDFEYYDASNTLFYRITLKDVQVATFAYLTPECSGCTSLSNQVSFDYVKIEVTDIVNNTTLRYSRATRTTY